MTATIRALPPARSATPATLLWREGTPDAIARAHDEVADLPAVDLLPLAGLRYGGRGLFADGAGLRLVPGAAPAYVAEAFERLGPDFALTRAWLGGLLDGPVAEAGGPALAAVHPNWIAGHALLEVVPRVLLLDAAAPPAWPLAVPAGAPGWLTALLDLAAPRRARLAVEGSLRAPLWLACSEPGRDGHVHPGVRPLLDLVKARVLLEGAEPAGPKRVWLSRRAHGGTRHHLENEDEVEAAAAGMGYAVATPGTMTAAEQVRLMHGARVVAGEWGPELQGALWARPGTAVVAVNWMNPLQSRIAALMGHKVGYVAPLGGFRPTAAVWAGSGRMRADPRAVADALRRAEDAVA